MGVVKLSTAEITSYQKYSNFLAGNTAYDPFAYQLIETITVGSGGAASVTFSNLNTYSTTYQHLQIRAVAQSSSLSMRMNGVTSAGSYKDHRLYGFGGSVSSDTVSTDRMYVATTFESSDTNQFTPIVIDILDPYESKNKTIRSFAGRPRSANAIIELCSGLFMSTNAVSSITLLAPSSISQNSRFSIYGLKAS